MRYDPLSGGLFSSRPVSALSGLGDGRLRTRLPAHGRTRVPRNCRSARRLGELDLIIDFTNYAWKCWTSIGPIGGSIAASCSLWPSQQLTTGSVSPPEFKKKRPELFSLLYWRNPTCVVGRPPRDPVETPRTIRRSWPLRPPLLRPRPLHPRPGHRRLGNRTPRPRHAPRRLHLRLRPRLATRRPGLPRRRPPTV